MRQFCRIICRKPELPHGRKAAVESNEQSTNQSFPSAVLESGLDVIQYEAECHEDDPYSGHKIKVLGLQQ